MWKKLIVMGIALLGTFSVILALESQFYATSEGGGTTNPAGTGRIGKLERGDRIYMGTKYNDKNMRMQLLSPNPNNNGNDVWLSMSEILEDSVHPFDVSEFTTTGWPAQPYDFNYGQSLIKPYFTTLNNSIVAGSIDDKIMVNRVHYNYAWPTLGDDYPQMASDTSANPDTKFWCLSSVETHDTTNALGSNVVFNESVSVINNLLKYKGNYWASTQASAYGRPPLWRYYNGSTGNGEFKDIPKIPTASENLPIRATAKLNLEDVVFAVSTGSSYTYANNIKKPEYNADAAYLSTGDYMKVRMENKQSPLTIDLVSIKKNSMDISEIGQGGFLELNYKNGTVSTGNKIGVILKNEAGDFSYYESIGDTKSNGTIKFNTKNVPLGTYTLSIVNEALTNDNAPNYSSVISQSKPITIVEGLSDLSYDSVYTPSNVPYYLSTIDGNVLASSKVGSISSKNGLGSANNENAIVYKLQPSSNATQAEDYKLFEIPVDSSTGKPILHAEDNNPYVIVNPENVEDYLAPGVYMYRVQVYDVNGDPVAYESSDAMKSNPQAQLNDGTIIKGVTPSKGLITDDITTVVYPHEKQLTNTQNKNTDTDAFYTLDELKELATDTVLGNLEFSTDSNINLLSDKGYVISSIKAVKPGTTTALTAFEVKAVTGNNNKFEIKKLAGDNFVKGDLTYDLIITFSNADKDTAIIKKTDQTFSIPEGLKYADPKDPSKFLKDATYKYVYDSETNKNDLTIVATDESAGTTLNKDVTYCILENNACVVSSSVITFVTPSNAGSQKITIEAPGTEKKSATIRATLMDEAGKEIITFKDLTIEIEPTKQKFTWAGTNIQSIGNSITKDTQDPIQTWNLSLKYDKTTSKNNEIILAKLNHGAMLSDTQIGLTSNVVSGTGLAITYKITPSNREDEGSVKIEDGKLKVTKPLKDTVTILATGAAVGNYSGTMDDDVTTTDVNEYSHAKLVISVSEKPTVTFTEDFTDSIIIKGTMAEGTVSLGEVGIKPSTETGYTYSVKSVKKVNEETSTEEEIKYDTEDSAIFIIKDTNQLFVNKPKSISKGTYVVEIKGTKGNEEATTKEVTIQVSEASLDVTKLKWQYKEDKSFIDVAGTINKTSNQNTETLSQTYKKDKSFFVKLENVAGSTLLTSDDTITYKLKDNSSAKVVSVSNTGKVDILGASPTDGTVIIEASITKDGYGTTKIYLPIKIDKADVEMQFVNENSTPYVLTNANDKTKYKTQSFVYAPETGVNVFTSNAPSGVDVTLSIVSTASTGNDILTFKGEEATANEDKATKTCLIAKDDYITQSKTKCQAQIQNAQKIASDNGKVTLKASVPESANHKAFTIEMLVNITKAEQTDFDFATSEETYESSEEGLIEPTFTNKSETYPNIGTGKVTLYTTDVDGNPVLPNDELRLGDPTSDVKYTDGIKNYIYNIVVAATEEPKEFNVYALKEGDRNYKESELKSQAITISPEGTSKYRLTFKSYPKAGGSFSTNVVYGHEYFHIDVKSIDDELDPDSTYAFEILDEYKDYVEVFGSNVGDFKVLKAGKIKIKVTRTSGTGVVSPSVNGSVTIEPRPVKLKIADIKKKNGMSVLTSDYKFTSDSGDFLANDKIKLDIKFEAKDSDGIDVTELSDGIRFIHNNLPITATITNKDVSDDVLSNYKITYMDGRTLGIEKGKLIISEEDSLATWYKVQEAQDTLIGNDSWYNGAVDVVLQPVAGSYDKISSDAKDWKSDKFTVTKEGQNDTDVYFRQGSGDSEGTIAKVQSKEIKIDITKPVIKSVTGTKVNDSGIAKFMNTATFGTFFKPGVEVVMESEDTNADATIKTSGIASIEYKAYTKDGESFKEIDKGSATLSGTTGKIKLADAGVYRVCAIAKDNAGNESDEYCSELDVKMIDIDLDGDDKLDMNDSNNDGCPDLNIVLGKDSKDKWIKLNIDNDGDKLPELNIDSDGDGIAELNVDTDGDGKPDINLVNVTKDMWKPEFHVSDQSEEYCTTKGLKAIINIKVSETSYINIDNNGDMKADVNITKEGSTKPTINLLLDETIVWMPNKDFTKDGLAYDTMDTLKPEFNIDSDEDGLPDLNVDMDGDRKPDINVDINGDGIPDINIDGNGDGERDYNIDTNGDGEADDNNIDLDEWNPSIKGDDYGTMDVVTKDELEDGGIKVERPNGKFLANYALRVNDVTDSISDSEKDAIGSVIESNQEIKQVYNVAMMKGETTIQPNGNLKVRIPIVKGLKNPKMVITQKDGSQKIVDAIEDNGYYVYESDYLGNVSIIGDKEEAPVEKEEPPVEKEEPKSPSIIEKPVLPDTSVKGNYTSGGVGGAGTGNRTNIVILMFTVLLSGGFVLTQLRNHKKQ